MNLILLGFVAGTASMQLLPALPDPAWFGIAILLPAVWIYPGLRLPAAFTAGLLWALLHAGLQLSGQLPANLEGRDLILTGVVASIPVQRSSITRFEMAVSRLEAAGRTLDGPGKVRLSWYHANRRLIPGQTWRLSVRLKRPRGFSNPGGFDYERWLFTQGIQATGYVRSGAANRLLALPLEGGWLDRLRLRLAAGIDSRMESTESAALVKALAIGDRSGLSKDAWRLFAATGTSHLIAISGLHVGMLAGLAFLLGQWAWRRSQWLTLRLAAPRAAAWLALGSATTYAALAGFTLPTQRALIMLGLGLGAIILGRSLSIGRSLTLALFGVVLVDPCAGMSIGFWLSFGAVGVILYTMGGRLRVPRGWRDLGRIQWKVALGLAPLLFIFFNQASLIAPLVNLLLIPWFSLVLVPLVLLSLASLGLPLVGGWLFAALDRLAAATLKLLEWCSQLPFALLHRPELPLWIWVSSMIAVLVLLLPKGTPGRMLGGLLLAPILLYRAPLPDPGAYRFSLLDVGQGLSAVVETHAHVLVYDTGPTFASGFNTAEAVLIPFLRSRGIAHIDRLIISNGDSDHAGGLEPLLTAMEVDSVLAGEALDAAAAQPCRMGRKWQWDGVKFEILHPAAEDGFRESNNRSCVLRVAAAGRSLLLTGDVEREAERLLVERYGDGLRSDILVVPHHGSKSSSTAAFVEHVHPAYALFPVGYRNRFGFPHPHVIERWRRAGADLLTTTESGAVQFEIEAGNASIEPELYRPAHPHLWTQAGIDE